MFIYLNGEIIDQTEAKISVFDHGFMYGLGVFETFRIYNGHPFLLDDHFLRLQKSTVELSIKYTYQKEEVLEILKKLCEINQLKDAYIRWNVSAGSGEIGLQVEPYDDPTTIVYIKSLPEKMATEKRGKILTIKRNSPEGQERLKSHHYLNNILGKKELGKDMQYEGIFLNEHGFIAEGIVSNLFWVKDGIVFTPSIETGILNGITRQFILKLLETQAIPYKEGMYTKEDLITADEAIFTNSIQEIVTITHIDELRFKKDNLITKSLQEKYAYYKDKLWSKEDIATKE